MEEKKLKIIKYIQSVKQNSDEIVDDITTLADTEGYKVDVNTSIFIRKNSELRRKNLYSIDEEFKSQAAFFNQKPEKYVTSKESIKKSYIEEMNRFMCEYNSCYLHIETEMFKAQEKQKSYMFKSCKYSNDKKIYKVSPKYQNFLVQRKKIIDKIGEDGDLESYYKVIKHKDPCEELERRIQICKDKINLYEKIIGRCNEELQACIDRREVDFKNLFGEEESIALSQGHKNFLEIIFNMFNKDKQFSRLVLKKHAVKINNIKVAKMDEYINKMKQDLVNFDSELSQLYNLCGE